MSSIFVTVKYDCQAALNSPERVPGVLVLVNEEMSFKDVEDVARPLRWPNNIGKYGTHMPSTHLFVHPSTHPTYPIHTTPDFLQ